MTPAIRQAPGWWPALVQVVCDECGFRSRTYNTNEYREVVRSRIDRDQHVCYQEE